MPIETSTCLRHFGHEDFDLARIDGGVPSRCPVRGCSASLVEITYGSQKSGKRAKLWCQEHGIRLHSNTFAYWNGPDQQDAARLRNFIAGHELVRAIALPKGMKAEAHRLGYEMSEDALTWNVFVSLAATGKLREAAQLLTGRRLQSEPQLYLWGRRINDTDGKHALHQGLREVRERLEPDIHTFVTEPDIMLVAEGEMLICIEAKFGSGNPLADENPTKSGDKPSSRAGLLKRYLGDATSDQTKHRILTDKIGSTFHSQLFRNVVFASEMAGDMPWHVVNLVSSTQAVGPNNSTKSYVDPTADVCGYLHPNFAHGFTYRSWETLYAAAIAGDSDLADLDEYFQNKSAHFRRAFIL